MIKFVTDSSCDNFRYQDTDLAVAPLKIYTADREFIDTPELDVHEMLDYLLSFSGRSYTACPSAESWLNAFDGGDEIYVVTMTSHLSGTYNSACVARDMYLEAHPEAKICIVDTLTTGPEMRLIVEKIIEWRLAGRSFEEISSEIGSYIASTRLFFAFKSLHNFAQNGRVNKAIALLIEKLNIRITGTASEGGDIKPMHKCRGEKSSLERVFTDIKEAGFHGGKLRICHIENEALALQLSDKVRALYPDADIQVYPAGALCSYYGERGGIIIGCEC